MQAYIVVVLQIRASVMLVLLICNLQFFLCAMLDVLVLSVDVDTTLKMIIR